MAPAVEYTLEEEASFLGPVFESAGDSFHLVGHSFGGAVALKAALRLRGRLRSLTLYEPALFALLLSHAPDNPATREIIRLAESTSRLADSGRHEAAAEEFVDYWFRKGTWAAMRDEVRADIRKRMGRTRQRWDALLRDPIRLPDIASIDVATLFLSGKNSLLPARALAELLVQTLPRVRSVDIEGVGHMAPLTDPDRVNPLIDAFLQEAGA